VNKARTETSGLESDGQETADELLEKAGAAKQASLVLAQASTDAKNQALVSIARTLRKRAPSILAANDRDCARPASGRVELDRLRLNAERIETMARDVEAVAALADPIGEVFERTVRPNGLAISKRRVPLGVVGVVYESRPNVTSDIASLCLKTGNSVVLRGGREALESNAAIVEAIGEALAASELPPAGVQLIMSTDRTLVERMLRLRKYLDVIVPRGGDGLIRFTVENATVPVIETGAGVCHTYVDRSADPEMALRIVFNAKVHRPTICNALDTVLVHRDIAPGWLPQLAAAWADAKVEIRADPEAARLLGTARSSVTPASPEDWGKEFLALIAAVKIVGTLDEALDHIRAFGSGHSEAIVTSDASNARRFLNEVDAAAVYVNASTQFTDGGEFGLGAEVGISTQKLHARGPMGLKELTTYKWIIEGNGQIRA
jgi:glutamate-5-semialdehyde dehydrogenase